MEERFSVIRLLKGSISDVSIGTYEGSHSMEVNSILCNWTSHIALVAAGRKLLACLNSYVASRSNLEPVKTRMIGQ